MRAKPAPRAAAVPPSPSRTRTARSGPATSARFNGSDCAAVGRLSSTRRWTTSTRSRTGKVTPMLASSYAWGPGDKSLTFTIRQGVKFSNGTPLTANDVACTFNLIKEAARPSTCPASGPVLSSVTQTGADPGHDGLQRPRRCRGSTSPTRSPRSCPRPSGREVRQPVAYPDTHPVGTGPYDGEPLHGFRPTSPTPPTRPIGRRVSRRSRRSSTRPSPATTRPTTSSPPARPSGARSTSRASRRSTPPRARTSNTGSRRRSTSR